MRKRYTEQIKIGQKNNRLTVLEITKRYIKNRNKWFVICMCDCGTKHETTAQCFIEGKVKSCGCLARETASKVCKERNRKYTEGIVSHPLWISWRGMRRLNKKFCCEEWSSYENFYNWGLSNGWKEGLCLTRKNTEEIYSPENCIFDTLEHIASISEKNFEKGRKTTLEKYGVENVFQNGPIRDKIINDIYKKYGGKDLYHKHILDKTIETNIKKYGVEHYMCTEEFKNKSKETNLRKYGVENARVLDVTKEKAKKTMLKNYGVNNPMKSDAIRNKAKATWLKKYGVDNPNKAQLIRDKIVATSMKRYGKPYYNQCKGFQQKSIQDFVESITNKQFYSDWKILEGKEIDIYNDELKFGIEYCGLRWHTESKRGKKHHYNKYKICKDNGIRLITIFSDEWLNKNSQVKNFIMGSLGIATNRIMARKCDVREIDWKVGRDFIEKYHVQGCKSSSALSVGIFYQEVLLGVMLFNRHHRQGHTELILKRMAFIDDYQIIGGASKLLSFGIKWAKNNGYSKILSWSDNRWSYGNVYEKIGFVKDDEIKPDYCYINIDEPNKRISKQSCSKKNIGCPDDKSEYEFMKEKGHDRIWDCGKVRWSLNIQ